MNDEQFLIDIDDKKNWLKINMDYNPDGSLNEEQRIIVWPEGIHQRFDFTDSIFYGRNGYHEHTYGWEIFFMVDGSMDFTTHGKVCTVHSGDILFVPPYTSHSMEFLKPTRWRATFHDMNMCQILNDWNRIQKYCDSKLDDPVLEANYLANPQNILREKPVAKRVDKSEIPEVRTIDKWKNRYDFDGLVMKQVIDRSENNGVMEIWRLEMQDKFAVNYEHVVPQADLFYITEGEVDFEVGGEQFTAYHDCLVKIPAYVPRKFCSKGSSVMYDIGGITHWLDVIEDWMSLKQFSPEKYSDKEYVKNVLHRHSCYVESFGLTK